MAHRAAQLTAEVTGAIVDISASVSRRKSRQNAFTVSVSGTDQRAAMLSCFGHTGSEINLRINYANLENDCCISAFLRGVFFLAGLLQIRKKTTTSNLWFRL